MRIRHCPKCGSSSVSSNYSSAEYSSSTKYSCDDCDWSYTKGRGMGTGSSTYGVHPRDATPDKQTTLDQSEFEPSTPGQWCSMCETSAKPGHCRCVGEDQEGFCETCAKYSEHDIDEMLEVKTYFGKYKDNPFECTICGEKDPEYKVV